jgi:hypothetical protein
LRSETAFGFDTSSLNEVKSLLDEQGGDAHPD